jgi:hypothetical protein
MANTMPKTMPNPEPMHRLPLDHSVYPEMPCPPDDLLTPESKADYVHRICTAFDFGVFPERADWDRFSQWKPIFDFFPIPDSPAYHTFRQWFGWEPITRGTCGLEPPWRIQDRREGREDPCEHTV